MVLKRHSNFADKGNLFIAEETGTLDEHDTSVDLSRTGELRKVIDVRRHEHTVLLIGTFENIAIGRAKECTIPYVARIDAVGDVRNCGCRGKVLIEEELHGHGDARPEDTQSRIASRIRCPAF